MEIKSRATALEEYKDLLASFCYHAAQLAEINHTVTKEGTVRKEIRAQVDYLSGRLYYLKEAFLEVKRELGFGGGLSFLKDSCFDGFEIKGGCLYGDTSLADAITSDWLNSFEETENCYLYEVANYILFLAHPDCLNEEKEGKKIQQKNLVGKIFSFFFQRAA